MQKKKKTISLNPSTQCCPRNMVCLVRRQLVHQRRRRASRAGARTAAETSDGRVTPGVARPREYGGEEPSVAGWRTRPSWFSAWLAVVSLILLHPSTLSSSCLGRRTSAGAKTATDPGLRCRLSQARDVSAWRAMGEGGSLLGMRWPLVMI
ncbi:hypothetical protein LZ31DRAFT_38194 [Colletotrichum somersetense]|nr:hypothetical protein LZ31DRAFT_38194 [Colletotrichum somersetense]